MWALQAEDLAAEGREREAGTFSSKQRYSMAPHSPTPKETLVGNRDTCPFHNFSLFTTSMKFFKIHTWHSGNGAKAVLRVDAPLRTPWVAAPLQRETTALGFSAFPCRKDPSREAPGIQAEQCGISYVHWFMPQKENFCLSLQLRVHQVFEDQTGFLCLKMGIQTLLVGRARPG